MAGTGSKFATPLTAKTGNQGVQSQSGPGTGNPSTHLGSAPATTPILRRYCQGRRSSLSETNIHAINLNNDLAGEEGLTYSLPAKSSSTPVVQATTSTAQTISVPTGRSVTIDGRTLTLKTTPADKDQFVPTRTWDKTARNTLKPEDKIAFVKSATGFVLSKLNKLAVLSSKVDDDGILTHVYNLQAQIKSLRSHIVDHDMADVFTIVVPEDLTSTGALKVDTSNSNPTLESHDLFTDYPRLHPAVVASSNSWYNSWAEEDYVRENMNLTFSFLERNTDEKLWAKCLEECEEFHPLQRGGPLMFLLIVTRIQNNSESAITHLIDKVTKLKISKLTGENVDTAVSLVKATYQVLLSVSTSHRSYVPEDWNLVVLKVFQTTSVPAFNEIFKDEEKLALRDADKYGGQPVYSTVSQTLNQATKSYRRLLLEDKWVKSKPTSALAAPTSSFPSRTSHGSRSGGPRRPKPSCFNCGNPNHMVPTCPDDIDEERVARNKKAFFDAKKSAFPPKHKTAKDGRPLVRNSRGLYVHDRAAEVRDANKKLDKSVTALTTILENVATPPATPTTPAAPTAPTNSPTDPASYKAHVRDSVLAFLRPKKE